MIVIAHNIRSLHNVGSIFRSCDAFGVEKLYLTGITGTPPRKEIAKVALGSEHRVDWEFQEEVLSLVQTLRLGGHAIVALENADTSVPIQSLVEDRPLVLVLGNEVEGIDSSLLTECDHQVEILMLGQKKSLNVSVATGIALFALSQKNR